MHLPPGKLFFGWTYKPFDPSQPTAAGPATAPAPSVRLIYLYLCPTMHNADQVSTPCSRRRSPALPLAVQLCPVVRLERLLLHPPRLHLRRHLHLLRPRLLVSHQRRRQQKTLGRSILGPASARAATPSMASVMVQRPESRGSRTSSTSTVISLRVKVDSILYALLSPFVDLALSCPS